LKVNQNANAAALVIPQECGCLAIAACFNWPIFALRSRKSMSGALMLWREGTSRPVTSRYLF
jgi:hypothetical protein